MTRLPVFGQLLLVLMDLGSLQPWSVVSSVSSFQSHRLRSLRWCRLYLTSSACQVESDPLPTWLLKKSVIVLAPFLCWLFCWSLEHGVVPSSMKSAYITPILKKADLD